MSLTLLTNSLPRVLIILGLTVLGCGVSAPVYGQGAAEPAREQLLNGLRVLIWHRPGDQEVLLKLRIHSGAAFDVAGKAGQMAILGDILFPDATTREYLTDEMGGRLDVDTDYDSITVTLQGRAREFERIVEILRTAVVTTQITPENVARIRDGRIKIAKETNVSPALWADRAIATRLFGDFPYGRPHTGSAESLGRVDRADLLQARERFLNSNNATLVVSGGVPKNRAMRALRQLLGPWRKSERIVPTTFRQPEVPDVRTLIINAPTDQSAEVRLATRGVSRADRDFATAVVLALVARKRWETLSPELSRKPVFVRNEPHVLPGMFVMGAAVDTLLVGKTLKTAHDVLQSLASGPLPAAELEQAKGEASAQFTKELERPDSTTRAWLDIDTFGLPSISQQIGAFSSVSAADLQRVASSLFNKTRIASVVVGNSHQLKAMLEPNVKVELMGEIEKPQPNKAELKPATTIPIKKPD
ncbi:MAG: insulinase family protein [Pyrinomonadaceae bacterium]|nr:insulinase family protein [Pyrinomonadaceae bacterium]